MFIIHVHIIVKLEHLDAFKTATLDNARNSHQEPGVLRFDFLQQHDDLTRFTLVEVYKDEADLAAHRETAHFLRWREAVADMMQGERTRVVYDALFPDADDWQKE
ncbi:MAG: antibiotic biosynthesis monooxygenase [Chloroflexota bacterium]|nr:antibiotic biosynthesis monooxygenase [Chloroflexota bacterium]